MEKQYAERDAWELDKAGNYYCRHVAAMTDHGGGLVAAVAHDNLLGVQFHPEKSQGYGLELLARFLDWNP